MTRPWLIAGGFLVVASGLGFAIGGEGLSAVRAGVLASFVCALLLLVATDHPGIGFWVGSVAMAASLLSSSTLIPLGSGVLMGICLLMVKAPVTKSQRPVLLILAGCFVVGTVNGLLLVHGAPGSLAVLIEFTFALLWAASAVVHAIPLRHFLAFGVVYATVASAAVLVRTTTLEARDVDVMFGENANGVGFIAAAGIACAIGLASLSWRVGLVALCPVIVMTAAIVRSGSRGALVAAACALLATLVVAVSRRSALSGAAAVSLVAGALFLWGGSLTSTFSRMSGRNIHFWTTDMEIRWAALKFAWDTALRHPLTGVGFAQLPNQPHSAVTEIHDISAHNTFIGLFAAAGAPMLILIVLLAALASLRSVAGPTLAIVPVVVAAIVGGLTIEWYFGHAGSVFTAALALAASRPANLKPRDVSLGTVDA